MCKQLTAFHKVPVGSAYFMLTQEYMRDDKIDTNRSKQNVSEIMYGINF